jgi:hypothetical protein
LETTLTSQVSPTLIYPVLGGNWDLAFVRVSGHGLGNSFYTYFHAVALAEKSGARLVAPPWFCLKVGPLLHGSASRRLYWRMFKPFDGDLHGPAKIFALARSYRRRSTLIVGGSSEPVVIHGTLNYVVSDQFTFVGLHAHRSKIRERLLAIIRDPIPNDHRWGGGEYIAVHVRMGDFAKVTDLELIERGEPNLRIPLSWYLNLIAALRRRYPNKAIYLFSDGDKAALRSLLDQGVTLYRSGSDVTDLLMMAGASILVGSNSTYSRWAAFLGNMPSIWLKTKVAMEKPSDRASPVSYVGLENPNPTLLELP